MGKRSRRVQVNPHIEVRRIELDQAARVAEWEVWLAGGQLVEGLAGPGGQVVLMLKLCGEHARLTWSFRATEGVSLDAEVVQDPDLQLGLVDYVARRVSEPGCRYGLEVVRDRMGLELTGLDSVADW